MDASNLSSISQAESDEKIGEFWDSHDFTDFDTDASDVALEMAYSVPIERELYAALEEQAQQRGVQVETLVNLWLQQKLAEQGRQAA